MNRDANGSADHDARPAIQPMCQKRGDHADEGDALGDRLRDVRRRRDLVA